MFDGTTNTPDFSFVQTDNEEESYDTNVVDLNSSKLASTVSSTSSNTSLYGQYER